MRGFANGRFMGNRTRTKWPNVNYKRIFLFFGLGWQLRLRELRWDVGSFNLQPGLTAANTRTMLP